jgi:hypothetical protein
MEGSHVKERTSNLLKARSEAGGGEGSGLGGRTLRLLRDAQGKDSCWTWPCWGGSTHQGQAHVKECTSVALEMGTTNQFLFSKFPTLWHFEIQLKCDFLFPYYEIILYRNSLA